MPSPPLFAAAGSKVGLFIPQLLNCFITPHGQILYILRSTGVKLRGGRSLSLGVRLAGDGGRRFEFCEYAWRRQADADQSAEAISNAEINSPIYLLDPRMSIDIGRSKMALFRKKMFSAALAAPSRSAESSSFCIACGQRDGIRNEGRGTIPASVL
jgi:hypothetical protein